jgi:hypothetical protein
MRSHGWKGSTSDSDEKFKLGRRYTSPNTDDVQAEGLSLSPSVNIFASRARTRRRPIII